MTEFRLLAVDDDPSITEFVCHLATHAGFVADSTTGEQLHTVYKDFKPHVLVLDIQMPGRDGFNSMLYLGEHKERPQLIILSGSDAAYHKPADALAKSLGFPMHDIVAKPFDPIALQDALIALYESLASGKVTQ